MKNIIFSFLLTFSITSFAQETKGKVIYTAVVNITDENKHEAVRRINETITDLNNNVNFELNFDTKKSSFFYKDTDNVAKDLSLPRFMFPLNHFKNSFDSEKGIYIFNALGVEMLLMDISSYRISFKPDFNWVLVNESKTIDNKLCYKATGSSDIILHDEKKLIIEAWYCPEIPFKYGPSFYNGLPGLILELNTSQFSFFAKKIMLNTQEEIKILDFKGEDIDFIELKKQVLENLKDYKK